MIAVQHMVLLLEWSPATNSWDQRAQHQPDHVVADDDAQPAGHAGKRHGSPSQGTLLVHIFSAMSGTLLQTITLRLPDMASTVHRQQHSVNHITSSSLNGPHWEADMYRHSSDDHGQHDERQAAALPPVWAHCSLDLQALCWQSRTEIDACTRAGIESVGFHTFDAVYVLQTAPATVLISRAAGMAPTTGARPDTVHDRSHASTLTAVSGLSASGSSNTMLQLQNQRAMSALTAWRSYGPWAPSLSRHKARHVLEAAASIAWSDGRSESIGQRVPSGGLDAASRVMLQELSELLQSPALLAAVFAHPRYDKPLQHDIADLLNVLSQAPAPEASTLLSHDDHKGDVDRPIELHRMTNANSDLQESLQRYACPPSNI